MGLIETENKTYTLTVFSSTRIALKVKANLFFLMVI